LEVDDISIGPSLAAALPFVRAEVSLDQVNRIHAEIQAANGSPAGAAGGA
jgi:hypothetical protein